jgi:spore coat polysaccharide biosynthesis predicted glycosyltransferase SpsG
MKVLLRADASVTQGTGHVMRVLTLGDELAAAGHDVHLASAASNIPWLENLVSSKPFARHSVRAHSLDAELIDQIAPDWVVVDSYEIPGSLIGAARTHARVLAIVDGDDRGIDADLYLDHNVGAERLTWPAHVAERMLAGSEFALVRRAIRDVKRVDPWKFSTGTPRVLAVLGGSDPTGMIVDVARALSTVTGNLTATLVCAPAWRAEVNDIVRDKPNFTIIEPTDELPALLAHTDITISAAGTSSWELCTLAIPSILIEVVDNQTEGLREMTARGLVVGLSPTTLGREAIAPEITRQVDRLIDDEAVRRALSTTCTKDFDGQGAARVVEAMARFSGALPAHR